MLIYHRSVYYYQSIRKNDGVLRKRIHEITQIRIRYGYRRLHTLLDRESWEMNHKKVYRLYCKESLNLRRKRPKRRVAAAHRLARPERSMLEAWIFFRIICLTDSAYRDNF